MGDGCSPHRARAEARKNWVDFDEIDEFSNDQTKKEFHESLSMGLMTSCLFCIFLFLSFFSHVFSCLGRKKGVRERKNWSLPKKN